MWAGSARRYEHARDVTEQCETHAPLEHGNVRRKCRDCDDERNVPTAHEVAEQDAPGLVLLGHRDGGRADRRDKHDRARQQDWPHVRAAGEQP